MVGGVVPWSSKVEFEKKRTPRRSAFSFAVWTNMSFPFFYQEIQKYLISRISIGSVIYIYTFLRVSSKTENKEIVTVVQSTSIVGETQYTLLVTSITSFNNFGLILQWRNLEPRLFYRPKNKKNSSKNRTNNRRAYSQTMCRYTTAASSHICTYDC